MCDISISVIHLEKPNEISAVIECKIKIARDDFFDCDFN